ncbi:MAG: sialidase family protein, partial [Propionicimonas sp.]|nr:sialidase family protein [Propionicimonas sp.]
MTAAITPAWAASDPPTAQEPYFAEQTLFSAGEAGYNCFRIPAIVETTAGTLLAFAEGRVESCLDVGDIDIVMKRSTDGGLTWSGVQVVTEGDGSTRGNPVPVVDANSGRIVLLQTHNLSNDCSQGCDRDPFIQYSQDDGLTWTTAAEVPALKSADWDLWFATGPGHAIQLTRGPHAGRLIVSANHQNLQVKGGHVGYSDDGGLTWQLGAIADRDDDVIIADESSPIELIDGRVYMSVRNQGTGEGNRAYALSSDSGETFDGPFAIVEDLQVPVVQGTTLRFHATDAGDDENRILFSAPAHPGARRAMAIRSSYDEAATWETWQEGKIIHWGPSAYSDMTRIGDDLIGLIYERGTATPYEQLSFARMNEAFLDSDNTEPPSTDPDPSGPTTPDASGNGNVAYLRGGPTLTDGRFGNALSLDGIDDHAEVGYNASIDVADGEFTMATWFRYTQTTGAYPILWAYGMTAGPQLWLRAEPGSGRVRAWVET